MEKEIVEEICTYNKEGSLIRLYTLEECEKYFGNKKHVTTEELITATFTATPLKNCKKRSEKK